MNTSVERESIAKAQEKIIQHGHEDAHAESHIYTIVPSTAITNRWRSLYHIQWLEHDGPCISSIRNS